MFQINENWDLVINFTPDLKTSNSGRASGQSLEALFGLIGRKLFFKTKGFEIDLAQDKDMLAITVNKEKLLSMLNDSTAQAGSTTVAAKTNSLAVIIMEHLVGNMVMAEERMELGQRLSLDVHQGRKGRYVDLVCNLLNYKNEYKEIYGDGHEYILPSQLDELSTHLKYLDERQIGADRANNNGFVTVEYDYGQADATGKIHTRHALTLDSFIKDAAGEIIALNLINPWGTVEQLSIHDAISKNIFLTFYTPR